MNRLSFSIEIKAGKAQIWNALWSDSGYRSWVGVFMEGSYAVADDWKEGSQVMFLVPDKSGIYSKIERHVPNERMQFRHIGNVVEGKEQPLDDEVRAWSGAIEAYTLSEIADGVRLDVEIDVMDEHLDFMASTFPKALEKVKNSCS